MPKKKKETILFICAHSDDHVLGAGGTIARYRKEGKRIRVIILSYGELTHPWLKKRVARRMRSNETKGADRLLGCTSIFFGLTEGQFMKEYPKVRKKLLAIINKEKPKKIFTHNNEDPHRDHKAAFEITLDAIRAANLKPDVYGFSIWDLFSLKKSHLPRMVVDVTETYGKKVEAIRKFRSQRPALFLLLWSIFIRNIKSGFRTKGALAELFYKIA